MKLSRAESVQKWRSNTKVRIIKSMGGSCVICGYYQCGAALALHHLDPSQKDFNLSSGLKNPKSLSSLVVELKKCVLLCHNCHNELHAGISFLPENYAKFNESFSDYKETQKSIKYPQTYCPICNKKKQFNLKHCSHECAFISNYKVDWGSIDLLEELKTRTYVSIAKQLGCSDNAVKKHKNRLLKKLPLLSMEE